MKQKAILGMIGLGLSCSIYANDVTTQIVNGIDASAADYPSFASLFLEDEAGYFFSRSFCGATVINNEYVLTAAHCIVGSEPALPYVTVSVGLENEERYDDNPRYRVKEFYFPSTYVDSNVQLWPDDIAILKIEGSMGTGDLYSTLNFSRDRDYVAVNDTFTAVGHGKQEFDELVDDPKLRKVELDYVDNGVCTADHGPNITNKQICFNGDPGATYRNAICSGDSGGPIYVSQSGGPISQVGISSFGYTQCGLDAGNATTSVFTEIYDYKAWIDSVIQGNTTPSYEIRVVNGTRQLVDNTTSSASSDSSGGSFSVNSLLSLLFVSFLVRLRRKGSVGKK